MFNAVFNNKLIQLPTLAVASVLAMMSSAHALEVTFADDNTATWNGKTIPASQQCQKFDGVNPATPALKVSDIPAGSDSVVLIYSDLDSKRMNNGGHGIMSYTFDKGMSAVENGTLVLPSVFGHTYEMPVGYDMIAEHRGAGWDIAGAYMPPCSGGKDHAYTVEVQSYQGNTVTGETTLMLGQY